MTSSEAKPHGATAPTADALASSGKASGRPKAQLLRLLAGQNDILDLIARGLPLQQIFDRLARVVDDLAAPALSAILLVDQGHLRLAAAPSLPEDYRRSIDGIAIGPNVGSCGSAVHDKQAVVARDIASDPRWVGYRDHALAANLQACWSQPVLTDDGEVVATFALYYRMPREPRPADWDIISCMARLVRLAIERDRRDQALRDIELSLRADQAELHERIRELETARSDLTAARNDAVMADRAKSSFLANMSHELRTPLNAIIGFSDVMLGEIMGPIDNPAYRGYVRDIYDSGRHLLAIINDVLALSKIGAGQITLNPEPIWLPALCGACLRLMEVPAEQAGVSLEMELADQLPVVHVDQMRLKQALLNLLSNAVKFTPAGGRVVLKARQEATGEVVLEVSDTGIGMTAADMQLAVQPFRQIDNAFARKYNGTSLGLPLAKAFIEMHGGTLRMASEPGHFTTVTVTLPSQCLQPSSPPPAGDANDADPLI